MQRTIAAMKVMVTTLSVATNDRLEIQDLTERVARLPGVDEISHGVVLIHSLHTTAGVLINEFQEALLHDIQSFLKRIVPETGAYRHNDPAYSDCNRGNAWSHLAALMINTTLQIPIEQGRLVLGTWQRILFCELDGPQTRQLYAQVMGV